MPRTLGTHEKKPDHQDPNVPANTRPWKKQCSRVHHPFLLWQGFSPALGISTLFFSARWAARPSNVQYHGVFEHMARVYDVPLQGAYNPPCYDQQQYQQYEQQHEGDDDEYCRDDTSFNDDVWIRWKDDDGGLMVDLAWILGDLEWMWKLGLINSSKGVILV
ncbi:hypothetical protein Tco_1103257 [Tanacetum coccineum]